MIQPLWCWAFDAAKAVKLAAQGKSVSKISSGGYENGYLNLRSGLMGCDRAVAQDCNGTWFLSLAWFCGFTSRSAGLGLRVG